MGNFGKFGGGVVVMEEKVSAVVVKNLLEAEMEDIFIGKVRVCGVENFGGVGVVWCGVVAKF